MSRKSLRLALAAFFAAVFGAVAMASPAQAGTIGGYRDDYNPAGCDGMVYVSDTTMSGRVETFGGFNCPPGTRLTGYVQIYLYKNGSEVCKGGANYNLASTASTSCSVANSSGSQAWKAKLQIFDNYGNRYITTGELWT